MSLGDANLSEFVLADTSGLYALCDVSDIGHGPITRFLTTEKPRLLTTNYIFAELMTLIRFRLGHGMAIRFGERVRGSDLCFSIWVDSIEEERAWEIFKRYSDKRWSYTDCVSMAVMERRGIHRALTRDHNFAQTGFEVVPASP